MASSLGKMGLPRIELGAIAVILQGNSAAQLAVSGVAAQTGALGQGLYDLWCDTVDLNVKVNTTANDVTLLTGYKIYTGNVVRVVVGDGDKIGAIAAAAGTLNYHKVS